jgi:bifunctional enzyme CysN/CysC
MADLGELERSTRRYRIVGGPRTGKSSIRDLLFGRLWLPANRAPVTLAVVDVTRGLDAEARTALLEALAAGSSQVVVAVNRMDLAGYEYEAYKTVRQQIERAVERTQADPMAIVPVSARFGDNIVHPGNHIDWHAGPTLVDALAAASVRTPVHG